MLENKILLHDPALRLRAPSVEGNLPAQFTSFVGRTKELTDVSDLLAVSRLVNLVGPAGSGKTRLAVEVAEHGADGFPDGVWFTDLAPTTSPDGVADTVATVFGVKGRPERPAEAVLVDYLSDRELLLVLDNCEHVVEGVVPLVARLLQTHERLTILATSREPLGMAGENTYEVSPLSFPTDDHAPDIAMFDAVRLFVGGTQVNPERRCNLDVEEGVVSSRVNKGEDIEMVVSIEEPHREHRAANPWGVRPWTQLLEVR